MSLDVKEINSKVKDQSLFIQQLMSEIAKVIVGQHYCIP